MNPRIVPLLLVAAACASTPNTAYTAADAEPCNVALPADTAPWQLVRAQGFTFCVPGDWTPTRGRSSSWRTQGASIRWTDDQELAPVVFRDPGDPTPPPAYMPRTGRRITETIGGREAELWMLDTGGGVRTDATWRRPYLRISGEARTRELGMLQLDIYRTVRFAP